MVKQRADNAAKKERAESKIIKSDGGSGSDEDLPRPPSAKRGPYKTSQGGKQKLTPEQKAENHRKAVQKHKK